MFACVIRFEKLFVFAFMWFAWLDDLWNCNGIALTVSLVTSQAVNMSTHAHAFPWFCMLVILRPHFRADVFSPRNDDDSALQIVPEQPDQKVFKVGGEPPRHPATPAHGAAVGRRAASKVLACLLPWASGTASRASGSE